MKKVLCILFALILVFTLSACKKNDQQDPQGGESANAGTTASGELNEAETPEDGEETTQFGSSTTIDDNSSDTQGGTSGDIYDTSKVDDGSDGQYGKIHF